MKYDIHTVDSAPRKARPLLEQARAASGMVPNLMGIMAESPALLASYQRLTKEFAESSLDSTEQQIVILATSYENNCSYCVAAHTVICSMQNVPPDVVDAIRSGRPIADEKLEALRHLTTAIVASNGWPSDFAVHEFYEAGYTKENLLDVILGVGLKTLSNYTNHIVDTPLDAAFSKATWTPPNRQRDSK